MNHRGKGRRIDSYREPASLPHLLVDRALRRNRATEGWVLLPGSRDIAKIALAASGLAHARATSKRLNRDLVQAFPLCTGGVAKEGIQILRHIADRVLHAYSLGIAGIDCKQPRVGFSEASRQPAADFLQWQSEADEELPEEGVDRAHFIEAHFVDQLLEDHGILGEEIHAPFPVVHADGAADDLFYLAAVTAADQAVLVHHVLAVGIWHGVPVRLLAALAVHGIEADIF